jgi:transposase
MASSIIGIDISKAALDCFDVASGTSSRIATTDCMTWIKELKTRANILVVFEATGVYSTRLGAALAAANIAYAQVNPRHVRRFAQACGILAKNDRIDAQLIARYASACEVKPTTPASGHAQALRQMVARREQLLAMLQAERGNLEACDTLSIVASIQEHITALDAQMKLINKDIDALTVQDARTAHMLTMPGIGQVVVASLLAHLPELGSLSREQVAALAGLAPYVRDSGNFRGKRAIYGGRPAIRKSLYMAALVAIRHNPTYHARYNALKEKGKPFKVALVAIMRHMLTTLNAMCKNNSSWKYV